MKQLYVSMFDISSFVPRIPSMALSLIQKPVSVCVLHCEMLLSSLNLEDITGFLFIYFYDIDIFGV